MRRFKLLLAGPSGGFLDELGGRLAQRGATVSACADAPAMLRALDAEQFDVAVVDGSLGDRAWREALGRVRQSPSPAALIRVGTAADTGSLEAGRDDETHDVLALPCEVRVAEQTVLRAWTSRRRWLEGELLRREAAGADGLPEIVTQFAPMQAVVALVDRVAQSDAGVLITGEPGTGKLLFARVMHRLSARAAAPFVRADCRQPEERLEALLFGEEPSTSAEGGPGFPGLLELADGGTLFLRNADALGLHLQGRLLRALELRWLYRTGGRQKVDADVRLIAAAARDVGRLVDRGEFRDDLYFRMNAIGVQLPPLRERRTDIVLLARHFLERARGLGAPRLSDDAAAALEAAPWPGNVRELRETIERAVPSADGVLGASDLRLPGVVSRDFAAAAPDALMPTLREVERGQIEFVLRSTGWHQGRAARQLGISPKTLYRKIREYGLVRIPVL